MKIMLHVIMKVTMQYASLLSPNEVNIRASTSDLILAKALILAQSRSEFDTTPLNTIAIASIFRTHSIPISSFNNDSSLQLLSFLYT